MTELEKEIDKPTTVVGNFNALHPAIDFFKKSKQKSAIAEQI